MHSYLKTGTLFGSMQLPKDKLIADLVQGKNRVQFRVGQLRLPSKSACTRIPKNRSIILPIYFRYADTSPHVV